MEAIAIRAFSPAQDEPYIYATWLRNYKHSSYFAQKIKMRSFFFFHHLIAERILSKPEAKVTIATPTGEPNIILGYLIREEWAGNDLVDQGEKLIAHGQNIIHFVFVKPEFRRMGVARTLMQAADINPNQCIFTHWTYPVSEFMQKYPEMTYNPYCV